MHSHEQQETLLYDIETVCELVSLSRSSVYEELTTGRLRSIYVGKRRLIPRDALSAWIADRESEGVR